MAPFAAGAHAVTAPPASPAGRIGAIPTPTLIHPQPRGGALANIAPEPVALAAAESEGSARRAFCSEIPLDDGAAPEWIRLFPDGPELAAIDGRRWSLSDAAAVAAVTDERRGSVDLCIDWEHAQDRAAPEGRRADAAGWIKEVAARDGALMGRVEWAAGGRESVEGRGYRYFSPCFAHARKIRLPGQPHGGEVIAVVGGSLVNRPAFDMPALAGQQEDSVNEFLKKVLEALGLASDAGEDKALAALAALKTERDEAVSQAAADPPPDKFVPRGLYDTAMARAATAEGKLAEQAGEALAADTKRELDAAQAAGKFAPAQRPWFEARCAEEGGLEKIRELLGTAGSAAPGPGGGSPAPPPPAAAGFRSSEEAAIASIFRRDAKFLDEHAPVSQGAS